jgi:hypothetical protein
MPGIAPIRGIRLVSRPGDPIVAPAGAGVDAFMLVHQWSDARTAKAARPSCSPWAPGAGRIGTAPL